MLEQRLHELWYEAGTGATLLAPLELLYGAAVGLRRSAYRRGVLRTRRVGLPVVVVGNLTVGGTGKTPLCIWLVEQLAAREVRAGVISRGFGAAAGARSAHVVHADSRFEQVGDEPLLIKRRTGCVTVVAADRVAAAEVAARHGLDVLIADDGLQHLRLARDCEIAVIDGARGFGNARLLPAGPLREPLARLAEVDAIVVNGAPTHASLASLADTGARPVLRMNLVEGLAQRVDGRGTPQSLEQFRGGPLHAVAGIGHPQRFFAALRARGLTLIEHPFPDHHPLTRAQLEFGDDYPIVMTEKDAMRCEGFAGPRMWCVPVAAQLPGAAGERLLELVLRACRAQAARAR